MHNYTHANESCHAALQNHYILGPSSKRICKKHVAHLKSKGSWMQCTWLKKWVRGIHPKPLLSSLSSMRIHGIHSALCNTSINTFLCAHASPRTRFEWFCALSSGSLATVDLGSCTWASSVRGSRPLDGCPCGWPSDLYDSFWVRLLARKTSIWHRTWVAESCLPPSQWAGQVERNLKSYLICINFASSFVVTSLLIC